MTYLTILNVVVVKSRRFKGDEASFLDSKARRSMMGFSRDETRWIAGYKQVQGGDERVDGISKASITETSEWRMNWVITRSPS